MKICLTVIGKMGDQSLSQLLEKYAKRIVHYIPFEQEIIEDTKNVKNLSENEQKVLEGNKILKSIQPGDYVILLDEKGRELTSRSFAEFIEKKIQTIAKRIVFVIGGPYGFSDEVYARANEKLSLSKMTFTHEMVRLIFTEQLYRAMTILNGEPYHHE
jgi:23S rRNA (pseudouridine1915-N3)-methyltransferase